MMAGTGGVYQDEVPDLPMEARETPDQVRARLEAKVAKSHSPWANRAPRPEPVEPPVDVRFVEPDLADPAPKPAPKPRPKPAPRPAPKPVPAPEPIEVDDAVEASIAEHDVDLGLGGHGDAVAPAPVQPTPVAPPRPEEPAATARVEAMRRRKDATAQIVRDYIAGATIPALAKTYGHSTSTIRHVLTATPGLTLRDDRATRSGGKPKPYPPEQVAAVRRLYCEDLLTQDEVAAELRITRKVVAAIMARHDIPARPDVVNAGITYNRPGTSTLAAYRAEIEAAGITVGDLRVWARENDIDVRPTGLPPRTLLATYLAAHQPDELAPPARPVHQEAPTMPDPTNVTRTVTHTITVERSASAYLPLGDLEALVDAARSSTVPFGPDAKVTFKDLSTAARVAVPHLVLTETTQLATTPTCQDRFCEGDCATCGAHCTQACDCPKGRNA